MERMGGRGVDDEEGPIRTKRREQWRCWMTIVPKSSWTIMFAISSWSLRVEVERGVDWRWAAWGSVAAIVEGVEGGSVEARGL